MSKPLMNSRKDRWLSERIEQVAESVQWLTRAVEMGSDALEKKVADLEMRVAELELEGKDVPGRFTFEDIDPHAAATAEVAAELRPDRYEVFHKGFGRYVVKDNDTGAEYRAPDAGWMTKSEAKAKLKELVGLLN